MNNSTKIGFSIIAGLFVLFIIATIVAIVGLFVIPVVGAPIGFVLAIYVSERLRVGKEQAWPATKRSLRAVATSIGIELITGLLIAAIWFVTVLTT